MIAFDVLTTVAGGQFQEAAIADATLSLFTDGQLGSELVTAPVVVTAPAVGGGNGGGAFAPFGSLFDVAVERDLRDPNYPKYLELLKEANFKLAKEKHKVEHLEAKLDELEHRDYSLWERLLTEADKAPKITPVNVIKLDAVKPQPSLGNVTVVVRRSNSEFVVVLLLAVSVMSLIYSVTTKV